MTDVSIPEKAAVGRVDRQDGGRRSRAITIIASFDVGGSLSSSAEAIEALQRDRSFAAAAPSSAFSERLQASYRFSQEPTILAACERIELALPSWQGTASQRISIHPAGVITFSLRLSADNTTIEQSAEIEDEFYAANAVRYRPYLKAAFESSRDVYEGLANSERDCGIDLVARVQRIREILGSAIEPRTRLYPPIDARMVVSEVTNSPLDANAEDLLNEYVQSRVGASKPPTFVATELAPPKHTAHYWDGVLYASSDAEACLLIAADERREGIALDCIEAAHQMWFLSRTWVGVLDQIGTLKIDDSEIDEVELRALERRVVDLSTLEFEIARSMVTVESAGVMLREHWQSDLIKRTLHSFETDVQLRLIKQRLTAVDSNHKTVAEILDRAHQKSARQQADRLQLLFSGAVAAAVTALIPATAELSGPNAGFLQGLTWALTGVVWLLFAVTIAALSRFRVRLSPAEHGRASSKTSPDATDS